MNFKSYFRREPVLVTSLVAGALGWISTFLVSHGVITDTRASALVQEILPTVVLVVLGLMGAFLREYVTPALTRAEAELNLFADRVAPAAVPEIERFEQKFDEGIKWWMDGSATLTTPAALSASVRPPTAAQEGFSLARVGPSDPLPSSTPPESSLEDVQAAEPMNAGTQS